MNVPSFAFLGFAAVAALLFNLVRHAGYRQAVLLITNLLFFASLVPSAAACVPFAGFLLLGYGLLRLVAARPGAAGKVWFIASVLLVIALFAWLKRYGCFPTEWLLAYPYATVGLSYVFFRVLHVVIDARGGALPPITLLGYLNYTLNFTALVSGPIQRYQDYHAQTASLARPGVIGSGQALERIFIGMFKVFLLSHVLHDLQLQALAQLPGAVGLWPTVALGMLVAASYPLFLYCNFSGYTDVVLGVGYFFGLRLPENFNHPFIAENFINFWARWHMSLSNWLKTYVYNPLLMALMERFPARAVEPWLGVLAFFVTFFLVGIWHGQTSEFVMFGILQGGGVAVNKLYQIHMAQRLGKKRYKALGAQPLYLAAARGLTFSWFAFTLFWFWAGWAQISAYYTALGVVGSLLVWAGIWAGASVAIEVVWRSWALLLRLRAGEAPLARSRYTRTVSITTVAALTTVYILLASSPAPDIVYKTF